MGALRAQHRETLHRAGGYQEVRARGVLTGSCAGAAQPVVSSAALRHAQGTGLSAAASRPCSLPTTTVWEAMLVHYCVACAVNGLRRQRSPLSGAALPGPAAARRFPALPLCRLSPFYSRVRLLVCVCDWFGVRLRQPPRSASNRVPWRLGTGVEVAEETGEAEVAVASVSFRLWRPANVHA